MITDICRCDLLAMINMMDTILIIETILIY
jgi:hypothetical protein